MGVTLRSGARVLSPKTTRRFFRTLAYQRSYLLGERMRGLQFWESGDDLFGQFHDAPTYQRLAKGRLFGKLFKIPSCYFF